jgi:preprotein translocase subunit SecG
LERVVESNKNVVYIGLGALAAVVFVFWLLPPQILRPLLYILLGLGSVMLVLLVLIQRGRGGGLAGALGGMGGYSAFGTRAGDVFTRITIIAAALWILGAMALARMNVAGSKLYDNPGAAPRTVLNAGEGKGAEGTDANDESGGGNEAKAPSSDGDSGSSDK